MSAAIRTRVFFGLVALAALASVTELAVTLAAEFQEISPGVRTMTVQTSTPARQPGFTQMTAAATGIQFTNLLSVDRHLTNQIYLNGSGVTAGDVDGDGWCDLYFCGLDGDNALYRNLGNWKFEEIAQSSGVACHGLDCTGATFADLDGDGDLDLVVNTIGQGTHIFLNDGKGHFTDITAAQPLNPGRGGMSMALADVNGDGALDLYVANYRTWTIRDHPGTRMRFNTVGGKIVENGEAHAFFINNGHAQFRPVGFTSGAFLDEAGRPIEKELYDWGLSAMFRDINGDGLPDLYICNDFSAPDRIWLNTGKGRFRAMPTAALGHTSRFSMGIDFADINRDGHNDFFVADMLPRDHRMKHRQLMEMGPVDTMSGLFGRRPQFSQNTLFLNRGDDTYAEIGAFAGVAASDWSWTPIFLDVDLDGYEDLIITTGHEREALNADITMQIEAFKRDARPSPKELIAMQGRFPRLATGKAAFRNRGNLTFEDVSDKWGLDAPSVSHGMCLADLDNDGDMDVVVNNLNGVAGVYRNESGAPRVGVRLKGLPPNTRGIGGAIRVLGGAVPMQSQEMICGGRYLSGDDAMRVFAAGSATNGMTIEVAWRSGRRSVVQGVKSGRVYEIDEAGAAAKGTARESGAEKAEPLFEDVSRLIGHVHVEEPFEDFARQPLLPNRLSQLGPGVGWADVDGDGREDLLVASGKGGSLGLFLNDGKGGFTPAREGIWTQTATRDQTTVLGFGRGRVLVGSANYEDGLALGGAVKLYDAQSREVGDASGAYEWSAGALALADVDGDGDLDLFVGGRVIGGRYGEAAGSVLLRNEGGKFVEWQKFGRLGMVSGAVFSDLDGDGRPELIVACEWGPVRVFRMENNVFVEITAKLGLAGQTGWWTGVAAGDLDGDGRMDLVVGNWGLNTKYRASREHPRRMYVGDMDGNGTVEVIESYFDVAMGKEVPERGLKAVSMAIPLVQERWASYEAYGKAGVEEIYGEKLKGMEMLEAVTLETTLFLNRGERFEAVALPREAQLAPVFGVNVGDMDGDGREDVFLSQNFFAVNAESARSDAGRGVWLRGDGKGGLVAVPGQESGVEVYGEGRGSALCDYDGDGRVDLVVGQNGAETKLYRNRGAKAGLRVRLRGGAGNPDGIGAKIRLMAGGRKGPVREVRSGSGYWSADGPVQVMSLGQEAPGEVWVQWPGGRETTSPVPPSAKEIEITTDGTAKVTR
jgi:hypothetical protein